MDASLQLLDRNEYECVILFAAWESYIGWPSFEKAFCDTIDLIRATGTRVVVVLPVPDQRVNVPLALAAAIRRGTNPEKVGVPAALRSANIAPLKKAIEKFEVGDIILVDPVEALSDNSGLIRAEFEGSAVYSDNQHLSKLGSHLVAKHIFPQVLQQLETISGVHEAEE